jgi:hypothetical protein
MPRGPGGEKRPADVIGQRRPRHADRNRQRRSLVAEVGRRAANLPEARRAEIARRAAQARWKK